MFSNAVAGLKSESTLPSFLLSLMDVGPIYSFHVFALKQLN